MSHDKQYILGCKRGCSMVHVRTFETLYSLCANAVSDISACTQVKVRHAIGENQVVLQSHLLSPRAAQSSPPAHVRAQSNAL